MSTTAPAASTLTIVGIGEDGWGGLGEAARAAVLAAPTILGAARQLALLPAAVTGRREPWPSPMAPRVDALAAALDAGEDASQWLVLASGDPMLHGIGATLAARCGAGRLRVLPAPSAFSLACARLGWAAHETPLISRVADPAMPVGEVLRQARRAVVYVPGASGARELASALRAAGLGTAAMTIFERLGGPGERRIPTSAADWHDDADPLHLVALELAHAPDIAPGGDRLASRVPGLPDDMFGGDGQLTRAEVRAVALAALAPRPGELLWDVGAGSGTIAIEWCRAAPGASAIAIERREDRAASIASNASALGAERVSVTVGEAPPALVGLPVPDAVFVGGGPSSPGLLQACWDALTPGGRLVANAVTLEGEQALIGALARFGGRLVRLEIAHAEPLGSFTGWKPQRPVVQWSAIKSSSNTEVTR